MDRRTFFKFTGAALATTCFYNRFSGTGSHSIHNLFSNPDLDVIGKLSDIIIPGNLVLIAARPSLGKTNLALGIGEYLADDQNKSVIYLPVYATVNDLINRRIRTNKLDQHPSLNQKDELETYIRKKHKAHGRLDLVIIDNLEELYLYAGNQAAAMRTLIWAKRLAATYKTTVLLTANLKMYVCDREDHRPLVSDLTFTNRYPAPIDAVILMYRDEIYHPDSLMPGMLEITVNKINNQQYEPYYLAVDFREDPEVNRRKRLSRT
jgi:replicative DNA helicase